MRILSVIPILLFALAAVIFGGVMFVKIGAAQRMRESEMQSIRTGQVPAETLTVVRKYAYSQKSGPPHCYVVFCNVAKAEIKNMTSQQFYDGAKVGGHAVGYSFPDGYVIPAAMDAPTNGAAMAKWIFLGAGLGMGLIFFLVALRSLVMAAKNDSPSIADAIRSRMNQSSEL